MAIKALIIESRQKVWYWRDGKYVLASNEQVYKVQLCPDDILHQFLPETDKKAGSQP